MDKTKIKKVHVVYKTHLDIGFTNTGKNVLQKYKMHYNDTREDEIQGTQRCCIFHPPYLSEFWMRFADTE